MASQAPKVRKVSATLRLVEWSVLAAVVLVLLQVLSWQMRKLQAQAERVTVQTTLSALRTALVIHYMQHTAAAPKNPALVQQSNPFELLEQRPANYLGPMSAQQATSAAPGSWLFEPDCVCVGYTPINPQRFTSPSGSPMLWYGVQSDAVPPQLTAKEDYRWQDQPLN